MLGIHRKLNGGSRVVLPASFLMVLMLFLAACSSGSGAGTVPGTGSKTIEIANTAFNPQQVTIPVGTTVIWTNKDSMAHTVTADDKSFDSGNLNPGDSYQFTFKTAGTYPYYCKYHGGPKGVGMSGVITVTGK